jgi:hypothetical protein
MSTKEQLQERKDAQEELRKILKPGQTVYTILRHVSKSGMSRTISVVIVEAGEIREISWLVARALGGKMAPNGGIKVTGCGMDMGHHIVDLMRHWVFTGPETLEQRWL